MSHLTTVDSEVVDIEALAQGCDALGWELREGGKVVYYYGEGPECDYTIHFPVGHACKRYTIGLKWNEGSGVYDVLCDNAMNGPVTEEGLGGMTPQILGELTQQYNYAVVLANKETSWGLEETTDDEGNIIMEFDVPEGGY